MKNGQLKIEKGIPIPSFTGRGRAKGPLALALVAMKKGDSVYVEKGRSTVAQTVQRYLGRGKGAIRSEGKGFRIWKIA